MNKPWMTIQHNDGEYKIFVSVNGVRKMFDLSSEELTDMIEKNISRCKDEIEMWNSLLNTQTHWIKTREYKC